MRKWLDLLYRVSGGLAAASLVGITALVAIQVLFNVIDYVAIRLFGVSFGLLIPSYAALAGYALAFATFLSLGLGLRRAVHIRVTLLESQLPKPLRRITLFFVALLGVVMGGIFVYSLAIITYQSYIWGDQGTGMLSVPLWIPQLVMCIGLVVFWIAAIDTFIDVCRTGKSPALREIDPTEDAL